MGDYVTNTHNIVLRGTDGADQTDIHRALLDYLGIRDVCRDYMDGITPFWRINVLRTRGEATGVCHVYVKDQQHFNILTTSSRLEEEKREKEFAARTGIDKEKKEVVDEEPEAASKVDPFAEGTRVNWADVEFDEDDLCQTVEDVVKVEDPVVEIWRDSHLDIINRSNDDTPRAEIMPAWIQTDTGEDKCHNIVMVRNLPDLWGETVIKHYFSFFCEDPVTLNYRGVNSNNQPVYDTYPFVYMFDSKQTAYVRFDPSTREAQAAILGAMKNIPGSIMMLAPTHVLPSLESYGKVNYKNVSPKQPSRSRSPKVRTSSKLSDSGERSTEVKGEVKSVAKGEVKTVAKPVNKKQKTKYKKKVTIVDNDGFVTVGRR